MTTFHLAQLNLARLVAPIETPAIDEFREALDRINALAEVSPGFVWRATGTGFDSETPAEGEDPQLLFNLSVWESAEQLAAFVFRSGHSHFVRNRRQWFETADSAYQVMWWIPAGTLPTRAEALDRLDLIRAKGPSERAFDFATRYPAPTPSDVLP